MATSLKYGNNQSVNLSTGGVSLTTGSNDLVTINGGGNTVKTGTSNTITINDTETVAAGTTGTVTFADSVAMDSGSTLTLNYTANLGDSANATINVADTIKGGSATTNLTVNAGSYDTLNFASTGQSYTLNAGGGDTITTTGANNTITIGNSANADMSASTGGACSRGVVLTVGATAAGTTFNGGVGTDTFAAGSGYNGGNTYIGSVGSYSQLFDGAGNCVNYGALTGCHVVANLNNGTGSAYDANGNLLWTDKYQNIEQVRGTAQDGNDLTGSDSLFSELKGGKGSTSYHGGAAGDRIIWGLAGKTGLDDGQGTDTAYAGSGADEFYWRNQNNAKGISNFGETVYGWNSSQDDLNFSELCTSGYAGVSKTFAGNAADAVNWVSVKLSGGDTYVYFDKTGSGNFNGGAAAVLKNDNLFADYGVNSTASNASSQVVQAMYNSGHLVLNKTH